MSEAFLEEHNDEITFFSRKFSSYFTSITRNDIRLWLKNFKPNHLNIALKLLRSVDFYDPPRIINSYRTAHQQLLATINSSSLDDVTFFPFGHAGKSGSSMIHHYRNANNLPQSKFKYFSEITSYFQALGEESPKEPKLVFIDDFIGTGSQAIDTWNGIRRISFPRDAQSFLLTLTGFDQAIDKVTEHTDLQVITPKLLSEEDRVFSHNNTIFDNAERNILIQYCESLDQWPMGFGNCQALVVFYFKSPDDIISILRGRTCDWTPLFPRSV